jgi:hypothetical protein
MDRWKRLQSIDNRVIYWVVFIAIAIPLLRPLGIPLTVGDTTKMQHNLIEILKKGDVVLMSLDYTALVAPEVHPSAEALCRHLFGKGVKVVFWGYIQEGPMFGEKLIRDLGSQYNLVYGTDVINLGYVPGGASGVRAFGDNLLGSAPRDFRNNTTANMPIMKDIRTAKDFKLVLGVGDGLETMVQQIGAVHGAKVGGASTAAGVSGLLPYLNSKQLSGFLQGLRGAAEYEILISRPGSAVAKMDAQSIGHLVIIGFIVICNFAFFMQKKEKKAGT